MSRLTTLRLGALAVQQCSPFCCSSRLRCWFSRRGFHGGLGLNTMPGFKRFNPLLLRWEWLLR